MEEPIRPAEVHSILARVMPIETQRFSLELFEHERPAVFERDDSIWMILRLIAWDVDGDQRIIRDIKEQDVTIVGKKHRDQRSRLEPYLQGWRNAVHQVFERAEQIDMVMPHELVAPSILGLKKATPADFEGAALAKGRLGKWLARRIP